VTCGFHVKYGSNIELGESLKCLIDNKEIHETSSVSPLTWTDEKDIPKKPRSISDINPLVTKLDLFKAIEQG
jgi:hypothetical protein